jgi:hypothetical protein
MVLERLKDSDIVFGHSVPTEILDTVHHLRLQNCSVSEAGPAHVSARMGIGVG